MHKERTKESLLFVLIIIGMIVTSYFLVTTITSASYNDWLKEISL